MDERKSSSGGKVERKTVEKNRRLLMKKLCYSLVSIIPDHHFNSPKGLFNESHITEAKTYENVKELLPQQEQLEQAIDYIRLLTEKIENLKKKKQELTAHSSARTNIATSSAVEGSNFPIMEISESDSTLDVVLITGLRQNFAVGRVIGIVEEEGAQVVSIGFSIVGDRIFHTFQAQVVPRVGVDTSILSARIRNLF